MVAVAVSITAVAVYVVAADGLRDRVDEQLRDRAQAVVETGFRDNAGSDIDAFMATAFLDNSDVALGLLFPITTSATGSADVSRSSVVYVNGEPFEFAHGGSSSEPFGTPEEPVGAPELAVAAGEAESSLRTRGDYRVYATQASPRQTIVLAQSLLPTERLLGRLAWILTLVGGLGVAVAVALGTAVARTGLRPVARLVAATRRVAERGDLTPIEVVGDDELAGLARRFNEMLAALRIARRRQRRLITTAAQELRAPLDVMRTRIDMLINSGRSGVPSLTVEQRRDVQTEVISQLDELARIVGDVVDRARMEHMSALGDTGEHRFSFPDPPTSPAAPVGVATTVAPRTGAASKRGRRRSTSGGKHRRDSGGRRFRSSK